MTPMVRLIVCSAALLALAGCGDKSNDKPPANAPAANVAGNDGSAAGAADAAQSLVPLKLYWNASRADNFTTGTVIGEQSAKDAQYAFIRVEGRAYSKPITGTIPLILYWNGGLSDNFSAAGPMAEQKAMAGSYEGIRVEGYVLQKPTEDTVPLKLYYSPDRTEYLAVASDRGIKDALDAGYQYLGTMGYVFPAE